MNQLSLLPARAWDEDSVIVTREKRRLCKWGSTADAGKILFGAGRKKIMTLIKAEQIRAVKQGNARNSHWRIDLVSVWKLKTELETGEALDDLLR